MAKWIIFNNSPWGYPWANLAGSGTIVLLLFLASWYHQVIMSVVCLLNICDHYRKSNNNSKRAWAQALWCATVIVGIIFIFTLVEVKGPNKRLKRKRNILNLEKRILTQLYFYWIIVQLTWFYKFILSWNNANKQQFFFA